MCTFIADRRAPLFLPELTGNPVTAPLGLLAEANVRSIGGLGEYQRAVDLYDEAAETIQACGNEAETRLALRSARFGR